MQLSYAAVVAILSFTAAAAPNTARNVPDTCDKQYDQCTSSGAADCTTKQVTCLSNCQAGLNSCENSNFSYEHCAKVFTACAGHEPVKKRNVPDSCDKQYSQCTSAGGSDCETKQVTCLSSCQASLNSCSNSNFDYATCAKSFTACAGHEPVKKRNTRDSCDKQYDQCKSSGASDCEVSQVTCLSSCQASLNSCANSNFDYATCAKSFVDCAGHDPVKKRNQADTCEEQYGQCVTMDGASFADCNNKLSICDSNCEDAYDSCVTGPNANHATCVANYASCSGKLPTLKRNQADSCDTQFDQCRGEKGANLSTCVSKQATCESNCEDGYNSCVTAPDANMSTCNATYAKCAGHIRGQ